MDTLAVRGRGQRPFWPGRQPSGPWGVQSVEGLSEKDMGPGAGSPPSAPNGGEKQEAETPRRRWEHTLNTIAQQQGQGDGIWVFREQRGKKRVFEIPFHLLPHCSCGGMNKTGLSRDFPGDPVVKTLRSQWRGHGYNPWLGNEGPACHKVQPKREKDKTGLSSRSSQHRAGGTRLHSVPSCSRQSLSCREPLLRLWAQGTLRASAALMLVKIPPLQQDHSVLVFKASDSVQQLMLSNTHAMPILTRNTKFWFWTLTRSLVNVVLKPEGSLEAHELHGVASFRGITKRPQVYSSKREIPVEPSLKSRFQSSSSQQGGPFTPWTSPQIPAA